MAQIHQLSKKDTGFSSSDLFVTDNGSTTTYTDFATLSKAALETYAGSTLAGSAQSVVTALAKEVMVVTFASFSEMGTWTATGVTAKHVVLNAVLGTPSAQTGNWTVTTATDAITIAGSISGSTTLTLYLGVPGTTVAASTS